MPRSVPIWRGKTPDTKAPNRVRLRVFDRFGGKCHRCGRKVQTGERWTLEHLVALVNDGANDETNLGVTCDNCLPAKNAEDVAEKAKVAATRQKHLGITKEGPKLQTRGFTPSPKSEKRRKKAEDMNRLPPRQIYRSADR